MNAQLQKSKKKSKIAGSFNYDDSTNGIAIHGGKITSLTFNGNQAHFSGTAKGGGKGKSKGMSFTVDVTDNGNPDTLDTFSIQAGSGYSASGNLLDGHITVH